MKKNYLLIQMQIQLDSLFTIYKTTVARKFSYMNMLIYFI